VEGEVPDRYPIRGIFAACCASASTAKASNTAATKIDDQPAFFISHLIADAITHTVIAETIIYGRRETGFVDRERAKFRRRIELNDASVRFSFDETGQASLTLRREMQVSRLTGLCYLCLRWRLKNKPTDE
jgi:hypothetical protein